MRFCQRNCRIPPRLPDMEISVDLFPVLDKIRLNSSNDELRRDLTSRRFQTPAGNGLRQLPSVLGAMRAAHVFII
jgi:hypothetical protein